MCQIFLHLAFDYDEIIVTLNDEDQMIVHCTIFGSPEPDIKWFKDKWPLNISLLPRFRIYNHPDELREHTIASLIIERPSFVDNGEYVIEVSNEMGFERRVLNINYQTEDEYNALYYEKFKVHKELWKYHEYKEGEIRWEDRLPAVKEIIIEEPVVEETKKRKRKKKPKVLLDEDGNEIEPEEGEEGGEEDDGEECEEEEEEVEEEQEAEEDEDDEEEPNEWAVAVEPEAPVVVEEVPATVEAPVEVPAEVPVDPPAEAPVEAQVETPAEVPAEAQAEAPVEDQGGEEEGEEEEEEGEGEGAPKAAVEKKVDFSDVVQEKIIDTDAPPKDPTPEPEPEPVPEPVVEPVVEEEPVVEDFVVKKRKPKFHISEYQLKKKFYFVNKLYNLGVPSGRTFRLQAIVSSIDPITFEWRRNGRLLSNTPRTSIVTNPKTNVSILEVTRSRLQDNGRYTCNVTSEFSGIITDECDVSIYLPQPQDTGDQPPTFTRLLTGINFYRLQKY